jgi:tetratricopeptide (TPR) repeat protein
MRRPIGVGLALALCLLGGVRQGEPAEAEDNAAIATATDICADVPAELKKDADATQAELDTLMKALAEAPAAHANVQESAPLPPPKDVVDKAQIRLTWAQAQIAQAEQDIKQARTAPNPADRQSRLKDAQAKMENAREAVGALRAALHPEAPSNAQAVERRAGLFGLDPTSGAFAQLVRAAGLSQEGQTGTAFYDAPEGTYQEAAGELTIPGRKPIEVKTLSGVFRQVTGHVGPLFETVPAPGGPAVRLNPEARARLGDPVVQQDLRKVGGVALQVTLDLLGFLGLPDFRKPGPATVVESPVLVSLAGLHAALLAAGGRDLPPAAQYPGSIERVHGFILDPTRRDVLLVGSKARNLETRLDVDSLLVAIQAVWRDGLTPGVSLDPTVGNPGGPQRVRVIGVPPTSEFARVMLDADYTMKRMMMGYFRDAVPGFKSYAQLLSGRPEKAPASRFWFYPAPLGPRDAHLSRSRRTVLVETGLRLLTEDLRVVDDGYAGTGSMSALAAEAAERFTDALPAFENAPGIEPRGVFVRLHGLVDLVTMAKLWREMGLNYPVLDKLSRLPVRQLAGPESVPSYYPGLTATYARTADTAYSISGGVLARIRAGHRALDHYQDSTTQRLEDAADRFPGNAIAQPVAWSFALPRAGLDRRRMAERLVLAGQAALAGRQYALARAKFTEAAAADPFDAEPWAYLAQAESALQNLRAARAAIAKALDLEPGDEGLQCLALDIALRGGPNPDLSGWTPGIRQLLAKEYVERAQAALAEQRFPEARAHADAALQLSDDEPDAFLMRAVTAPDPTAPAAERDWIEAIGGYQKQLRGGANEEAKRRLAFALAQRALLRNSRIAEAEAADPTGRTALAELARAADEARKARALDDRSPLPLILEAHARALRVAIFRRQGSPGELSGARQLADEAVRRFPDVRDAYYTQAYVLQLDSKPREAVSALDRGIRVDPAFGLAFELRAELHAELKACPAAQQDLARARTLLRRVNPAVEKEVQQCR